MEYTKSVERMDYRRIMKSSRERLIPTFIRYFRYVTFFVYSPFVISVINVLIVNYRHGE